MNHFKKKNQNKPVSFKAELVDADREREERRKEKQSKKVEKLLQKKRTQEAQADADEATVDQPAVAQSEGVDESRPAPEEEEHSKAARHEQMKDERLKEKNSKRLEKLLQKQRKREKHSDRQVLSYEDMPLEDRPDEQKKAKKFRFKRRRIVLAGIILLALVAAVFLFTNSDRLSMHNITNFVKYGIFNLDSDQRFPVQLRDESISSGNFCRMGQDVCYAAGSQPENLNNYGKRMLTVQHGYTKPVLVCCDKYSLLYNLGGTAFQINSLTESIHTGTAENNILVADILNNGTYALVTQSDGYLSKLYVYNSDNDRIFSYSFSEYYITSVSLKSNGKMAVLGGVCAHNGNEISALYVLDFTKNAPVQFVELEDTVIYDVQYLSSTYAAAVSSKGAYVIDTDDGDLERTDYEGKVLTAYTFNTDTDTFSVSLSRSGDGRNCDIISFDTDGSVAKSFTTDLRVISLSSYKGRVALLTTDTIYLYSKGGDLLGSAASGIDPRSVVMYTSSDAYVLDTSEIRSVSL